MARIARVIASGIPHHVTQRGNRRMETFFHNEDYEEYLSDGGVVRQMWRDHLGILPHAKPYPPDRGSGDGRCLAPRHREGPSAATVA